MSRDRQRLGLVTAITQSKVVRAVGRLLRRFWSAILVMALIIGLAVAAFRSPGFKVADLNLDENSIYVVRQASSLLGNLNLSSDELANAQLVGAQDYQVIQSGAEVLVKSTNPNQISSYDPSTNQMGTPTNLPNAATVSVSGGLMVVTNPTNGRAWFGPVEQMLRTDFQLTPAQMEIGDAGLAVATSSGKVIGLNVQTSQLVRMVGTEQQSIEVPLTIEPTNAASIQLSAVGDKAVVLDRATGRIWVEGSDEIINVEGGSTAMLPDPAPAPAGGVEGTRAMYATAAGLIAVVKGGAKSMSGQVLGAPAKPLVKGECVYGAFGGRFVKSCAGQAPTNVEIPELPANADLRFADNRGQVVLNDANSGYIWLVDKGMKLIKDWDRVTPEQEKDGDKSNETQVLNPDRSKPNSKPVANDDMALAAREGRSTILPVLDNDFDPDGDLLTVLGPPTAKGVSFELVKGGSALQVTIPNNTKGSIDFTYSISDGRGKSATARARVKVLPADQSASNQPPFHLRTKEKLVIGQRQKGTKRVLVDWRDPDGDDLLLTGAKLEGSDDEVSFTSDGTLTFQDVGLTTGEKKVKLIVSDGKDEFEGELIVEVLKGRVAPPVANGDFYTAKVGTTLVLRPLDNDQGANLTLREIEVESKDKDVEATPNYHENTITFKAARPGTYYLVYTVSNGPITTGLIRIDVPGDSAKNTPPVAARDQVLLPPGGSVLMDPLANDYDADGQVLVIQTVEAPKELKVTMENRHLLQISAHSVPKRPLTITYWISDGISSVRGTIVVVPTDLMGSQQPEAQPDTFRARAGSVVTIPVLDNDRSPIGLDLSLKRIVEGPKDRAWIEGNKLRVAVPAGNAATALSLTYEIEDTEGRTASATVDIPVVSTDAANEAPTPVSIEARVLQGTTTRILIPLDGVDVNGDPVRLVGLGSGPQLGRVTSVGERYLSYEAFPTSQGTDSFRYMVVDSHGATATGEIRIGVAPPGGGNASPITGEDVIKVRPGAQVTLPLLLNDYDIDGDSIGFADKDPIDLPFPTKIVNGNAITFTAPMEAKTYTGKYFVIDSASTSGNGDITVIVDPNAPPLAPVAQDDHIAAQQVVGKDYVDINVLKNDYDLDASSSKLKVSLPSPADGVSMVPGKNEVRVKVSDFAQQVRYVITDADGKTATAVLTVAGRTDVRPTLKDPKGVTLTAGERTILKLDQLVAGTNGRAVRLTSVDEYSATLSGVIPSPDSFAWTPPVDYVGPAAIVFQVTDVVPQGDKTARTAYISLPVKVIAPPNAKKNTSDKRKLEQLPPVLVGPTPVLEVAAGEGGNRIDLRSHFKDPNGDEFRFTDWKRGGGDAQGVTWSPVGDQQVVISASADTQARPGATLNLTGTVMDVHTNTRPVTMIIRVVPSTRPRPKAVADSIPDAAAGRPSSVAVLANDVSYLLKDKKLTLVSARALGAGRAEKNGDNVVVTPNAGFVGELRVEYTIQDATNDPGRQSTGYISVTVRDKPGPPGVPVEQKSGDGYVTLRWTDGAANGMPITGRRLVVSRAESGAKTGQSTTCDTNTCTIKGLTNGKKYWFKVSQTNELGSSESKESADSTPDVVPEVMGAPTVKFGNGQLTVSWKPAVTRGSPIQEYSLVGNGPNASTISIKDPGQTSTVVKGLTNDKDYTFTIIAKNAKGWAVNPSPASTPEHPTGPPNAPRDVTAKDSGQKDGGWIDINWQAPDMSGKKDPITGYEVFVISGGKRTSLGRTDANTRSMTWKQAVNEQKYTFVVKASNRGPAPSADSAPSNEVSAYGAPPTPVGAGISAYNGTITFNRAPSNVEHVTKWRIQVFDARNDKLVVAPTDIAVGGSVSADIKNGREYYAQVQAWNKDKASDWGRTNGVVPVDDPSSPRLGERRAVEGDEAPMDVSISVDDESLQGHHWDDVVVQYQVNGGAVVTVDPDDMRDLGGGSGRYLTIENLATKGANQTIKAWVKTKNGPGATMTEVVEPPMAFSLDKKNNLIVSLRHFDSWSGSASCASAPPFTTIDLAVRLDGGAGMMRVAYVVIPPATQPAPPYTADVTCDGVRLKKTVNK